MDMINNKIFIKVEINFHVIKIQKFITENTNLKDNKLILSGSFQLLLSDFKINRPSFMLKKVDDLINLSYELHFAKL